MAAIHTQSRQTQQGFTLLEVLVALTITGMALGGLFGVIAGNKRLAWSSEEALISATYARSYINFSQLNDERGEVDIQFEDDTLILTVRQYELLDEYGEVMTQGTYWVELDLPEL